MKNIYPLLFLLITITYQTGFAQVDLPSVGAGYSNFTYYDLSDGSTTSHEHTVWDIAFEADPIGAGIHVNEGLSISFTGPVAGVELYATNSSDFSAVDTTGMVRIYNDDVSWTAGAFNHTADAVNPADYGWGIYDFNTHQVNGTRVYVIKLRNGNFKKIKIESLIGTAYNFVYANIDGSEEVSRTIDKTPFAEKTLIYYSLETDTILDLEPDTWDLLFTRYVTPIFDGSEFLEYTVTGVLSNKNVEIAEAVAVDPMSVDHELYDNAYSDTLTTIGYDWKSFTGTGWDIPQDLVYFVKSSQNQLWKLQFIDFTGSSSGITTVERTYIGEVTSVDESDFEHLNTLSIYPNPAIDHVNIAIEINTSVREGQLHLYNSVGQLLFEKNIEVHNDLNVYNLTLNYPKGIYYAMIKIGGDTIKRPIVIQ